MSVLDKITTECPAELRRQRWAQLTHAFHVEHEGDMLRRVIVDAVRHGRKWILRDAGRGRVEVWQR